MGKPHTRCTGIRWREVNGPWEALAAAIVLQAVKDWERLCEDGPDGVPWPKGSNRRELWAFFRSAWCRYLCEEAGIEYPRLLRYVAQVGKRRPRRAQRLTEVQREVLTALEALGGQARPAEVARATGRDSATVSHALRELAHMGRVRRVVKGRGHVTFVLRR